MTHRGAFDVVRRWRSVIVAGLVVGVVVGWLSAPGRTGKATTFEATHILLLRPGSPDGALINRTALLTRFGAVPERVATRLGLARAVIQSSVSARTNDNAGELFVTGRSSNRVLAETLANVMAEELVAELGGPNSPLQTLEPAAAVRVAADEVVGPTSRPSRAALLGVFGLFLGVGAAFAATRFDRRIRTKSMAEEALGIPVMAEVPIVPRPNGDWMVTGGEPPAFLEAHRRLRTMLDRKAELDGRASHRVIVVTSPIGGEGTTTTVAYLAAVLGEIGRSVVAISGDLRRPQLHLYFGKAREPGLSDVLRGAPDARRLADLNLATNTRGVRFVSSGAPLRNPAPLLNKVGDHLSEARTLGDIVLVDAPPVLTTSETADLAYHADGVLLVMRAGRTSVAAAARSVELLERLDIPVLGTVLIGSDGYAVRT
jgi:Mrp family chromosome partitioning ATPase